MASELGAGRPLMNFSLNTLKLHKRWVVSVIALGLASCGGSSAGEATPDTAGLTAFADSFDRAQLEKDGAALGRMVADDLIFITGSGERQDKAEFIAGWTAPGDSFDPITLVDREVR